MREREKERDRERKRVRERWGRAGPTLRKGVASESFRTDLGAETKGKDMIAKQQKMPLLPRIECLES